MIPKRSPLTTYVYQNLSRTGWIWKFKVLEYQIGHLQPSEVLHTNQLGKPGESVSSILSCILFTWSRHWPPWWTAGSRPPPSWSPSPSMTSALSSCRQAHPPHRQGRPLPHLQHLRPRPGRMINWVWRICILKVCSLMFIWNLRENVLPQQRNIGLGCF